MAVDPVAPALSTRLAAALSASYRIDGELRPGGMSRVFLATELRFQRRVVIKVLAPELAAELLLERFEREVQLTGALQDPHIVPVLSAGEVDGLPYYTMPYVEGASLRSRLDEVGPSTTMPTDDAVAILLDVGRALACAHAHGIVHRDIKPENVLLAGDTAVVTDFGIAKALERSSASLAPSGDPSAIGDTGTLTRLGTVVGTPGYMAPEQAAGGDVDARTDLYAWGVMAYEVLGGVHPFASRTSAVQLRAAHIGEQAVPLKHVMPALPPDLAELVMRCLAKDPDDRPRSANDVVAALRSGSTGSGERARPSPRRRRVVWMAAAGAAIVGVLTLSGWLLVPAELRTTMHTLFTRAPATLRVNRVVVAPFRNETGDPKLAQLGGLAADYLSEGLARLGSLQVVDAATAAATSEIVRSIPRFLRSGEDRAMGEETGAKVVVAGSYHLEGDSIRFRARIIDAETGAIRTALEPVSAPVTSPSLAITVLSARLAAVLRAASDEDATELAGLSPPPSLAAYGAFREGYQAYLRADDDSAIFPPLRRAMALDSTYGAPAVTLAYFASERSRFALADSALARARGFRDRLLPTELAMLDVTESLARGDMAAAVDAARRTRIPQLIAYLGILARRPQLVVSALTATDPDRGLNLATGLFYWTTMSEAYARIGLYDRALESIQVGVRRVPRLRELQREVDLAAEQGDVTAVRTALDAHGAFAWPELAQAVRTTTLLRAVGGRDVEGRALVDAWAAQLLPTVNLDTLPGSFTQPAADLLVATERWNEIPPVLDAALRLGMADSARGLGRPIAFPGFRRQLLVRRAVALVHLGRRAEALAIDAEFARTQGARWDGGRSTMARAVIAAHLGETDRAIGLLTRALTEGGMPSSRLADGRAPNLAASALLLPLRADPRYRALLGPDPGDVH